MPPTPRIAALAKPVLNPQTRSALRQLSPKQRSRLFKDVESQQIIAQRTAEAELRLKEQLEQRYDLVRPRAKVLGLEPLINKQPPEQRPLIGLMLEQATAAVEEGMEALRRHWVKQILSGSMTQWQSLSPATRREPGVARKPLVNTGRLMRLMASWPIQVSVVERGGEIELRADLVPDQVAEDHDPTLYYSIPQDMFTGRAAITSHRGKRMPAIPARPLKAPAGFLEGMQVGSFMSNMLVSKQVSWVY